MASAAQVKAHLCFNGLFSISANTTILALGWPKLPWFYVKGQGHCSLMFIPWVKKYGIQRMPFSSFNKHKLGLQGELVLLWRSNVTEVSCFGDIKYQNHLLGNSSEGPEGIHCCTSTTCIQIWDLRNDLSDFFFVFLRMKLSVAVTSCFMNVVFQKWKWIIFCTQAHRHRWGRTDYRAKLKGTVTLLFVKDVNGFCRQVAMFPVLFCTFTTWHLQSMRKSGGNSSLISLLAEAEPRFCSLHILEQSQKPWRHAEDN